MPRTSQNPAQTAMFCDRIGFIDYIGINPMQMASFIHHRSWIWAIVGILLVGVSSATAKEPYLEFLHALQQNGYGDVALEYIDRIEKDSALPKEIRDILDLERCNSYRSAARNAYESRLAEQYLADAQQFLDRFMKAHPNHPAAASAILSWGDFLFERGQQLSAEGRTSQDKEQKTKYFAEAKDYFQQAGSRYEESQKRYRERLAQLPAEEPKKDRKSASSARVALSERQEVELGELQARFQIGLVKYHLAQTFEDPKDPERVKLLKAAAECFDGIYQQYRLNVNEVCAFAHLWHGRTLEDLGDEETALDVYEEVLANVPDTGVGSLELAPLYSQAALFRFRMLRKQGKIDELIAEGSKWVETHKGKGTDPGRGWGRIPSFNGTVLELAKAYKDLAEKQSGNEMRKTLQKAVIVLADTTKVESEYKSEALFLRRDFLKQLGTENVGSAEFLALGDAALKENNLADAQKNFTQALEKAQEEKEEKTVEEAKRALNRVALRKVQDLYDAKKYEESLRAAESLCKEPAEDPSVVNAASLALWSAFWMGGTGKDKDESYAQLKKVADFVMKKWPGLPVADDARMVLAQSRLQQGDTAAALALFNEVKQESSRYPAVLFNIGRIHWIAYLEERKKGDPDDPKLAELRAKAQTPLQNCLDLLQKSIGPGRKLSNVDSGDMAEEVRAMQLAGETQLLLAEIALDAKEFDRAAGLVDPLIDRIKADKPQEIDKTILRTFMAAIRAHLLQNQVEKGGEITLLLLELSRDSRDVNSQLVLFTRLLHQELKFAEAAVIEGQDGNPQELEKAVKKRDALKGLLRKLIDPLAKRTEHALVDLIYLGDACFQLDFSEEGGQIYQRLLDRAKEDAEFAKKNEKALVRARSQLVNLLRSQKKYEEALKQAEELIARNPRALEPKMAKAYLLEDWSQSDPKKFDAAVAGWTDIRLLLNRLNPKPPEYFEVVYKCANCLFQQYEKNKDPSSLSSAEILLKQTQVNYAKLSGPDMVARYNELLKKIQTAKSKSPAGKKK